jgi:A/G-specific adenine glycosylase
VAARYYERAILPLEPIMEWDINTSMEHSDQDWYRRFRRNLRAWYNKHARDLPWRKTSDPYRIWIREIMLQQTTVTAVVPYFERFLAHFPTVQTLAEAAEDEVLRYWEGLGYYSRARNIHKSAITIVNELKGHFPETVADLAELPGIGRYTAGAIVSFAYDRPAPIVEANTLRLYSRLLAYRDDPRSTKGQRILWQFAETLVPKRAPGRFNQGLMELGGAVCVPQEPDCPQCPVRSCCGAFQQAAQTEIPVPKPRPEIIELTEASVAIRNDQGEYLLRRCLPGERWAGLWDFIRFPIELKHGLTKKGTVSKRLQSSIEKLSQSLTGLDVRVEEWVTEMRHSVTRYRITLHCFCAMSSDNSLPTTSEETSWVPPAQFKDYPLSVTGRKLAKLIQTRHTDDIRNG